jgi:hypothetical protein
MFLIRYIKKIQCAKNDIIKNKILFQTFLPVEDSLSIKGSIIAPRRGIIIKKAINGNIKNFESAEPKIALSIYVPVKNQKIPIKNPIITANKISQPVFILILLVIFRSILLFFSFFCFFHIFFFYRINHFLEFFKIS